ncbi:ATP-binding protein [Sphingomonas sp.]|uniref:ATP-binding protein n=1 Tax=Sphingomonas sp. TaxID=28214 RepID=UPI003F7109CA
MVNKTASAPDSSQGAVANVAVIDAELAWLEAVMAARFAAYGGDGEGETPPDPPSLEDAGGAYAGQLRALGLSCEERLILVLALAPYVAPAVLDSFLLHNQATGRRFTEFGGVTGQTHAGFLPTAETAMFLLAGDDRRLRIALEPLFGRDRPLVRGGLLQTDHRHPDEPPLSALLRLSEPALHQLLRGADYAPVPGANFPATRLTTPLDWQDLVLDDRTLEQVEMVSTWIAHGQTLMQDWGLGKRLKPGFRCLFHGGPGTGKTLTASLLGKRHGLPVYRVDLSRVVSKWIGETEKNLAGLFDQAEDRNWILFFDEADALFGKRTDASSANDRAANQQIAYLLQRLEDYSGLAILATNQHDYLDEAFARRFQSAIRFPMPDAAARARLWRDCFSNQRFAIADIDFDDLAQRHELAGGAISNVLRYACLSAVGRGEKTVQAHDLIAGIRREKQKDGQYVSRGGG